jgi:predicted DNA binding protein
VLAQIAIDALEDRQTSFDTLARRFAISRTHVRQLLRDAQRKACSTSTGKADSA